MYVELFLELGLTSRQQATHNQYRLDIIFKVRLGGQVFLLYSAVDAVELSIHPKIRVIIVHFPRNCVDVDAEIL